MPPAFLSQKYIKTECSRQSLCGQIIKCYDSHGSIKIVKLTLKERIKQMSGFTAENPLREAKILKALQPHFAIIHMEDETVYEDDKFLAITLEYCQRGDLFDYLTRCARNNIRIHQLIKYNWLRNLAEGIHFMHTNKICHLDLSLENILLTKNSQLRIADFGHARFFELGEKLEIENGLRVGKETYRAPEIQEKEAFYGDKADVWSFGVIMFILLFGHPPFENPSNKDQRFNKIFNRDFSDMLKIWRKTSDEKDLKLLRSIFVPAEQRTNIFKAVQMLDSDGKARRRKSR